MKTMDVKTLLQYDNTAFRLRTPDEKIIADYAQQMAQDEKFPPIVVGQYNEAGAVHFQIVDGLHRLYAAKAAGLTDLAAEVVKYESVTALLADMLKRNMGRGLLVRVADRDHRIKLLGQRGMTQAAIADSIGLTQASVSRILRDKQAAEETGRGTRGKKKPKKVEAYSEKAFYSTLPRLIKTLEKDGLQDIASYILPEGDDGMDEKASAVMVEVVNRAAELMAKLAKAVN